MLKFKEDGQAFLFDLDSWFGRTSQAHSQAEPRKERTSGSSSKRSRELVGTPYLFIDLTPGHGDLLGEPYWELRSPWHGDVLTHNTGVSPRDAIVSFLSQILEACVHPKYYLTAKACLGILRRANERGKKLPPKLERALLIQAGIVEPDGEPTEMGAYHINQRDEGIDLNGVSGALMATMNMQMQTFVTKENETEDEPNIIAFAANQRDEVRDLHDVAGALGAQPGMKQQTFVAAGFCAGASPTAGSIGFQEEISPTLKAGESGTNMVPSILCLNDQGGSVMECSEDIIGTLRAQEHGHQPVVLGSQQGNADIGIGICPTITAAAGMSGNNQPVLFENHGIASRYTGPHGLCPTVTARYGTGGGNTPLVGQSSQEVFSRQRVDIFKDNAMVSTQSARQHKDATDLVLDVAGVDCRNGEEHSEISGTLQAGTSGTSLNSVHPIRFHMLLRRLIPVECERLQGFPDNWTDVPKASDSARYKALGNSVAIPCVEFILKGLADEIRRA